jgi:hypothetical protein
MNNEFIEIKFPKGNPWYENWGTNCKFNKPTPKRKYIKILALCLSFATMSAIYPDVAHPLTHQLHDLWRHGYLNKYKKVGDRHVYYKTTQKGRDLLLTAVK